MRTKLSKSEEQIMLFLWESQEPMSAQEIIERCPNKVWKNSYIHLLVNSLLKKEMIEVRGYKMVRSANARLFSPTLTKEEFYVNQVSDVALCGANVSVFFNSLLSNIEDKDTILELRKIVDERLESLK